MKRSKIFTTMALIFTLCACKPKEVLDYTDTNPDQWYESPFITLNEDGKVIVTNGEVRTNNGEWQKDTLVTSIGEQIKFRVKSSFTPGNVSMARLILPSDTLFLKTKTKEYEVPQPTDSFRNTRLGLSGPDFKALGGYGKRWWKYNGDKSRLGSAVKQGLVPNIQPFINAQIRDTEICVGGDGRYYMTGSSGDDIWVFNDGIELWVSSDLKQWEYIGLVWSFDKDGTWQKEWRFHHRAVRAIWAPEIHYVKGNYYITISMPPGGRGLLKSATGRPEGPYANALADDGMWPVGIDGSLFEDEDGQVYYLCDGGKIAKMKEDMSGLAEEPRRPLLINPDMNPELHAKSCGRRENFGDVGHEGVFMFKRNGFYYLTAADSYEGRYSSVAAISENIYGPYRNRHEAVPCGGGTSYFRDKNGNWWCTFFGNDNQAPFREMPAMIKVAFSDKGMIYPANDQPFVLPQDKTEWEIHWNNIWKGKEFK